MRKKITEAILCIVLGIMFGILFLIRYRSLDYDIIWLWPILSMFWLIKGVVIFVKLKNEEKQKKEE